MKMKKAKQTIEENLQDRLALRAEANEKYDKVRQRALSQQKLV